MTPEQSIWATGLLKLNARDFPGALHRAFEDELGAVNSHLCVADAALRDFESAAKLDAAFVARRVRENGHRRLNVDVLQIAGVMELSYLSHVALLLGRMASLCVRVQGHPLVDRRLNELAKGDYFRRALWVVLQSQGYPTLQNPPESATILQYASASSIDTYDRLREMRNDQFHAAFAPPNAQGPRTRFPEVLACSKALQNMSRGLCRALAGPLPAIVTVLTKRCGNLRGDRRKHAARAVLEQEYLLDAADVHGILFDLAW